MSAAKKAKGGGRDADPIREFAPEEPDNKVKCTFCKIEYKNELSQIRNHLKRGGKCQGDVSTAARDLASTAIATSKVKSESRSFLAKQKLFSTSSPSSSTSTSAPASHSTPTDQSTSSQSTNQSQHQPNQRQPMMERFNFAGKVEMWTTVAANISLWIIATGLAPNTVANPLFQNIFVPLGVLYGIANWPTRYYSP